MYKLEDLLTEILEVQYEINGNWVPARPLPFYGISGFLMRLRNAWFVFRGKADAFTWPEGQ